MGQLQPETKIIIEAVDDMVDITTLHSEDDQVSAIGVNLLRHRFEKVPEEYKSEVYNCFEAYIAHLNQPRYDA